MINGILNIRKEKGYTSHDVVARLRGILRQKKIGHTGTLDPDATGVLPVCLGKATKLVSMIDGWEKSYEAVLLLGVETDTEDISGRILASSDKMPDLSELASVIAGFQGDYMQVPPMYSAKKVGGKKLYELAREGRVVERKPCPVTIKEIRIKSVDLPRVTLEVTCSKGTYIRSLCRDIGKKCGCGGCMEELVRTRVEMFQLEEARTLSEIEKYQSEDRLSEIILAVDRMFEDYPACRVDERENKRLVNGNTVPVDACVKISDHDGNEFDKAACVRLYDQAGQFYGIYERRDDGYYKPVRLFL